MIDAADRPRLKLIIHDLIDRIDYAEDELVIHWKLQ